MWLFFNPTIEVVTFRLRGWRTLGVFLLSDTHQYARLNSKEEEKDDGQLVAHLLYPVSDIL